MNRISLPAAAAWPKNRRVIGEHLNNLKASTNRARAGRRIGFIGTSLVQHCIAASASALYATSRSWIAFAHFFSNGIFDSPNWHDPRVFVGWETSGVLGATRYFRGLNAGVGGQTFAQVLARKEFLAQQLDCDLVVIDCGTNDMNPQSKESIQAAREQLCNYYLDNGIAVVLLPILARATNSWAAGSAARKKADWINSKSRQFCRSKKDCHFFDWNAYWVDSGNLNGEPLSGHSSDGIHFNIPGAVAVGDALAKFLSSLLPPAMPRVWSQNDIYDAIDNPLGNVLTNPYCLGTAGTRTGATVTGNVASDMKVELAGGNSTVVCSKEVRVENRGEFQVMQITTATTGAQDSLVYFRTNLSNTTHTLGGKWVQASIEVDVSASAILQGITLYLEDNNGTGKITVQGLSPFTAGSGDYNQGVVQRLPNRTLKGLIVTPAMVLPADSTALRWRLEVRVAATPDNSPATVTVKAGAVELREVQDPRVVVNYQAETV